MISTSTLTNWFQGFRSILPQKSKRNTSYCAPTPTASTVSPPLLAMQLWPIAGIEQGIFLQVQGVLNRLTYLAFMAKAQESYAQGARYLLLDLRQTRQIELSGLFALVSIARLFGGEEPLDPEGGWAVLHAAAGEFNETMGQRVKLLALSPEVRRSLTNGGFCQRLPLYDDETAALAAFQQMPEQS